MMGIRVPKGYIMSLRPPKTYPCVKPCHLVYCALKLVRQSWQ